MLFFWPMAVHWLMAWLMKKTGMGYLLVPWMAIVLAFVILPFGAYYYRKLTDLKDPTAWGKALLGMSVASTLMCILMGLTCLTNLFFKQNF